MNSFKVGDWVWLKGQIKGTEFGAAGAPVEIRNQKIFVSLRDCQPVEPSGGWEPAKDEIEYAMDRCGVPTSDPLASSPCMDGVDVDQFIEDIMDARGRTSDPLQVGDAVVVVERSHKWRGVRGRIVSVSESNEYPLEFISDCGKRLGYFRLSSLNRIDKVDQINSIHYKQGGIDALKNARRYLDRLIKEVGK